MSISLICARVWVCFDMNTQVVARKRCGHETLGEAFLTQMGSIWIGAGNITRTRHNDEKREVHHMMIGQPQNQPIWPLLHLKQPVKIAKVMGAGTGRGRGRGSDKMFSRPLFVVWHRLFLFFLLFVLFCLFCFCFEEFERWRKPRGAIKHGQKRICRVKEKKGGGNILPHLSTRGRKRKRDEWVVMKCNGVWMCFKLILESYDPFSWRNRKECCVSCIFSILQAPVSKIKCVFFNNFFIEGKIF